MKQSSESSIAIVPRQDLDFDLDGDIPRYWFGGDAFRTRFFDAMSTLFPEGERFFISCVRNFRDQVTDPVLQQQVKDFMRQEAQHGRVHDQYNHRLQQQGIRVDLIEAKTRSMMQWFLRRVPDKITLGQTAAAEHMTSIMAHSFFDRPEIFADADPRMRAMYVWHGVEEIEHKGVAYDTWLFATRDWRPWKRWKVKAKVMLLVTRNFIVDRTAGALELMRQDGVTGVRALALLLWYLWARPGMFRKIAGAWFKFFLPGFHPWNEDDRHLLAAYQRIAGGAEAKRKVRRAA